MIDKWSFQILFYIIRLISLFELTFGHNSISKFNEHTLCSRFQIPKFFEQPSLFLLILSTYIQFPCHTCSYAYSEFSVRSLSDLDESIGRRGIVNGFTEESTCHPRPTLESFPGPAGDVWRVGRGFMPASRARQRSIYSISEYGNITPLMSRVTPTRRDSLLTLNP